MLGLRGWLVIQALLLFNQYRWPIVKVLNSRRNARRTTISASILLIINRSIVEPVESLISLFRLVILRGSILGMNWFVLFLVVELHFVLRLNPRLIIIFVLLLLVL